MKRVPGAEFFDVQVHKELIQGRQIIFISCINGGDVTGWVISEVAVHEKLLCNLQTLFTGGWGGAPLRISQDHLSPKFAFFGIRECHDLIAGRFGNSAVDNMMKECIGEVVTSGDTTQNIVHTFQVAITAFLLFINVSLKFKGFGKGMDCEGGHILLLLLREGTLAPSFFLLGTVPVFLVGVEFFLGGMIGDDSQ